MYCPCTVCEFSELELKSRICMGPVSSWLTTDCQSRTSHGLVSRNSLTTSSWQYHDHDIPACRLRVVRDHLLWRGRGGGSLQVVVQDALHQHPVQRGQFLLGWGHQTEEERGHLETHFRWLLFILSFYCVVCDIHIQKQKRSRYLNRKWRILNWHFLDWRITGLTGRLLHGQQKIRHWKQQEACATFCATFC